MLEEQGYNTSGGVVAEEEARKKEVERVTDAETTSNKDKN
jgi:hypothetical protein